MKSFGAYLVFGLVVIVLALILLGRFGEGQAELRAEQAQIQQQHTRELAPLNLAVARVVRVSLAVLVGALAAVAATIGAVSLASIPHGIRYARIRSWQIRPTRNALYPTLAAPDGRGHLTLLNPVNETLSQAIAAMTNGNVDRLGGAGQVVKQFLNPKSEEFALPPPEIPEYAPEQVIQPDPQNKADTLVVGQKGAGKTNTLRWLIDAYRRAIPDAEFMVLSPVASNWAGLLPVISETEDIRLSVLALREELAARDRALTAAGVRDIHRLTNTEQDFRRLVVVVDEAETVADEIKLANQKLYREFTGTLRIVINTARNFGVCIIFGTQTARADVLDPAFMRNASTVLMMRMDAATAARFAQYDRKIVDGLPTLDRGRAYCPQAGGYIQFPLVETIRKPRISTIYTPSQQLAAGKAPLQLPADAEGDGLGADDLPDSPGVVLVNAGTGELEPELRAGGVFAAETPAFAPVPTVPVPVPAQRIESRRQPTPVEAAAMRAHYARHHSKTAVCMLWYGYKNDDVWGWVNLALEGQL